MDAEAFERLAVWALRYSPIVAADDPDGLVIDATSASHLRGGDRIRISETGGRFRRHSRSRLYRNSVANCYARRPSQQSRP
jgi:nucleotidyltransferase/DNA polymerase involved in DNA repair